MSKTKSGLTLVGVERALQMSRTKGRFEDIQTENVRSPDRAHGSLGGLGIAWNQLQSSSPCTTTSSTSENILTFFFTSKRSIVLYWIASVLCFFPRPPPSISPLAHAIAPFTMRLKPLSFFASLLALATADVDFTSPTPGSSTAEGSISVGWQDGSGPAPLSSLGGWQLFLVAGGDTDANAVCKGCRKAWTTLKWK